MSILNYTYNEQLDSKTELKSGKFLIQRSQRNGLQPHSYLNHLDTFPLIPAHHLALG